jgi:hypothetical protein
MNKSFFDLKSSKIGIELTRLAAPFSGDRLGFAAFNAKGDPIQAGVGVDDLCIEGDLIHVDFVADSSVSNLLEDLKSLGIQNESTFNQVVSGWLPFSSLTELNNLGTLRFAKPTYKPITANLSPVQSADNAIVAEIGSATGEGDKAQRSDKARDFFGIDGSDVKIGVISSSFDALGGYAADIASGDLPTGVEVLREFPGVPGSNVDEGRAMLQLIYDIAPGASLAFRTGFVSPVDFANGIVDLARSGSRIIVDDVFYPDQPFFQDGILAQAVNQVTRSGRVSYFSSAGNLGAQSYQSAYRPSTVIDEYQLHDFDPGPNVDNFQDIKLSTGESFRPSFQWDQPFATASALGRGSGSDLDVFVFSEPTFDPDFLVAISNVNNLGGDALEFISFEPQKEGTYYFAVGQFLPAGGPTPSVVKYIDFSPITRLDKPPVEYATFSSTSYAQQNSAGGLGVAAAFYRRTPEFGVNPPRPEPDTSLGGTPILFNNFGCRLPQQILRQQPGVTAPDGVSTTVSEFNPFFGTSASAPSAAAAAALLLDAVPRATNRDIYQALQNTAIDMDEPGFDFLTGFGLIQVDAAVRELRGDGLIPEQPGRPGFPERPGFPGRPGLPERPVSRPVLPIRPGCPGVPIPTSMVADQVMNNYSYSLTNGFSAALADQRDEPLFGSYSSTMLSGDSALQVSNTNEFGFIPDYL